MTRKPLRTLGLAVVAALAMSGLVASAAQAIEVDLGVASGYYTGTQINHKTESGEESTEHIFIAAKERKIKCKKAIFEGTVGDGDTSVTVTPTYSECVAGTLPAVVTTNGCTYKLYGGTAVSGGHSEDGTTDIICPSSAIEVHIYASAHTQSTGVSLCTVTVGAQTELHENTIQNSGSHDVVITTNIADIETTVHGSDLPCGVDSQTSTYTGATTVQGYSDVAPHKTLTKLTIK